MRHGCLQSRGYSRTRSPIAARQLLTLDHLQLTAWPKEYSKIFDSNIRLNAHPCCHRSEEQLEAHRHWPERQQIFHLECALQSTALTNGGASAAHPHCSSTTCTSNVVPYAVLVTGYRHVLTRHAILHYTAVYHPQGSTLPVERIPPTRSSLAVS